MQNIGIESNHILLYIKQKKKQYHNKKNHMKKKTHNKLKKKKCEKLGPKMEPKQILCFVWFFAPACPLGAH